MGLVVEGVDVVAVVVAGMSLVVVAYVFPPLHPPYYISSFVSFMLDDLAVAATLRSPLPRQTPKQYRAGGLRCRVCEAVRSGWGLQVLRGLVEQLFRLCGKWLKPMLRDRTVVVVMFRPPFTRHWGERGV